MGNHTGTWTARALALWVWAVAATAQAGGFVVAAGDGDGAPPHLAPLEQLTLTAVLDDAGARVTETRVYGQTSQQIASGITGRFHRSIVGPEGTRFVAATRDGGPLAGEVLGIEAADALRRELVNTLGEPSLLHELGTPMFVSDPVELPYPGAGISVDVETWVPWRDRGTLSAVDVPLDWSPEDVGVVKLDVEASTDAPLKALYSPYHALSVSRDGEHAARASYQGHAVCTRFDLTLLMSSGDEAFRLDVLPFRYDEVDGGHLLALLTPPATAPEGSATGRDIVLALDVSGSMAGEKIEQARAALDGVLARLSPEDRVAVVSFQTIVEGRSDSVLPASAANVDDARAFVGGLVAGGGTNIHGALETALGTLPGDGERPRYVVLLTDGQPTEGVTDVDAIVDVVAAYDGPSVRVFPFGIGYDVNTHLLDRLAGDTGGHAIYVRPGDSVADPVAAFFARIEAPVLTAPRVDFEALAIEDVHPAALPDLYAGETLALFARYGAPGAGTLRVSGIADGAPATHAYTVALPEHALTAGFVPRVWALRHVGALLSALKLGEAGEAAEAELRRVAERYGVVTDFTGYEPSEDGDMRFVYTPVTLAESGAAAVEASASISGYAQGSAVDAAVTTDVRYHQDRAFVPVAGYHTDTTLADAPEWVDLHFGSASYHTLAARDPFAAGMLAIARDVRFEWLGRAYRITDPATAAAGALPDEVSELPPPLRTLDTTDAVVATVEPSGADAPAAAEPEDMERVALEETDAEAPAKHVSACHVTRPGDESPRPAWPLAALALLWLARGATRRRRRKQPPSRDAVGGGLYPG